MRYFYGCGHEQFAPRKGRSEPLEHVRRLREVEDLGATVVAVMNCSGAGIEESIRVYAREVLPQLRGVAATSSA
jgi:hypothetical protein